MTSVAGRTLALLMLVVTAQPAQGRKKCTDTSGFAAAMDAAEAAVPCAAATKHKTYVKKAKQALAGQLKGECKKAFVKRFIRQSACGRPGTVVCCRSGRGQKGSTVLDAKNCENPCSSGFRNVGEACTPEGTCVTTTSTTTTTTSTTTTTTNPCGNGVKDPGEECDGSDFGADPCPSDPDAQLLCSADCHIEGCSPTFDLDFTNSLPHSQCGVTLDGSGAPILPPLGCGGLNIGGSISTVPEGPTPAGSVSHYFVRCPNPNLECIVLPVSTVPGMGTTEPDCTAIGCYFGTPLPIPVPSAVPGELGAQSTCVVNTFAKPASGTLNLATGAAELEVSLNSAVYLTGNLTGPPNFEPLCPKCVSGKCGTGARKGLDCISTNPDGYTRDCLPSTDTLIGTIPVDLSPLQTTERTETAPTGGFCPGQGTSPGNYQKKLGCFMKEQCRSITETGVPAGRLTPGTPSNVILASVFCIPAVEGLAGIVVNSAADLPGPGAVSLPGQFLLTERETTPSTTPSTSTTSTSTTSTTNTTESSSTSTTTQTTTTTITSLPCTDPTVLDFVNGTATGPCGEVRNSAGNLIKALTCGGLNIGGAGSLIPEGPISSGSVSRFALSCTGPNCVVGPTTAVPTVNTAEPDCTTTGCNFGTPLPIPNPATPTISTCVVNKWGTPASGTLDLATGAASLSIPLSADVYLTGTALCPKCSATGSPGSPGTGTCGSGARNGLPCTSTNPIGHTRDCLPLNSLKIGTISVDLSPAETATRTATQPSGLFCPGQSTAAAGCFGSTACRTIIENGVAAGTITPGTPANVTLASTFCIPATGNGAIDGSASLPGPGALSLPGTFTATCAP